MSMLKKLNDKLYLSLQLFNGPEGVSNKVFCELKDQLGVIVEPEFEIPHIANGFFSEGVKLMTSVEVIFAFFKVTESDGVTVSCEHTYSAQRYDRDFTGELVQSLRPINATIIGEVSGGDISVNISDLEAIEGVIEDPDIIGVSEDNDIIAVQDSEAITGEVQ